MGKLRPVWLGVNGYGSAEVLIETGTADGIGTARVASMYPTIHTIELNAVSQARAKQRLFKFPHVQCHLGDSVTVLPRVIDTRKKTVFWLDAHFIGGDGFSPDPTVILRELAIILGQPWHAPLAVLIDDAEKFGERYWELLGSARHDKSNWPRAAEVEQVIRRYGDRYDVLRTRVGEVWAIERDWR